MRHPVISLQIHRNLMAGLAVAVLLMLAGCQTVPRPAQIAAAHAEVTAYVIGDGWHTDVALPVSAIGGPLQAVIRDFPTARYLRFGWGERAWYMAQQHSASEALRALFPGKAALLVTPMGRAPSSPPAGRQVFPVGLTTEGARGMADYIWAAFEQPPRRMPGRFGFDPDAGAVLYAANGTYSATHTCNTWTADALRAGGIPVNSAGVVFAGQLTDQLGAPEDPGH